MATATSNFEVSRPLLSRAILEAVNSWPELQRRIFIQAHYGGKSIADIADRLGISPHEVNETLERSEHQLHEALKVFRETHVQGGACAPYHEFSHPTACCYR